MPTSPCRCLHTHLVDDERTPIAALRGVALVSQALHQGGPCPGNAFGAPAGRGRLAREAVARHRRNDQVKRVRGAPAVGRGIGQRLDDLELLDDRAGPAVGDDERQGILVFRANVDEVNVEPIDLGDEMRVGVQLRLDLAPVVLRRPVARQLLNRGELDALGVICDGLLLGPARGQDAVTQVLEVGLGGLEGERPDSGGGLGLLHRGGHGGLLLSGFVTALWVCDERRQHPRRRTTR